MSREIDAQVAETVMGWVDVEAAPVGGRYTTVVGRRESWPHDERSCIPPYSSDVASCMFVVDRLRAAGIEVIIGCFSTHFCVELRHWADRRAEGVPGDPDTGRSRVTFCCVTGSSFPAAVCEAALRPETLAALGVE